MRSQPRGAEPKSAKAFICVGLLSPNRELNSSKFPRSATKLLEWFPVTWRKQWSHQRSRNIRSHSDSRVREEEGQEWGIPEQMHHMRLENQPSMFIKRAQPIFNLVRRALLRGALLRSSDVTTLMSQNQLPNGNLK